MALLITLTVITLLIVVSLELNRRARNTVFAAAATRDRFALSQMLISGMHAGIAMLVEDRRQTPIDSLQEDWADPEKVTALVQALDFEDGKMELQITDERSRIQVNALVRFPEGRDFDVYQPNLWRRFLTGALLAREETEVADPVNTIVNSLKDWLDSGDDDAVTGLTGAESDYYQDLEPSYNARNGPLPHLAELLQVKGVTPELYYGSEEIPGISEFLSVFGMTAGSGNGATFDGQININTAELPVLAALLAETDAELATAIEAYRLEKKGEVFANDLSNVQWYRNVPGAGNVQIEEALITVRSDLFRISAIAALQEMSMALTAVVRREIDPRTGQIHCRILSLELQ
jgi:general secretion pathway protein K